MKRTFLVLFSIILMAGGLWAGGSRESASGAGNGKTTLILWDQYYRGVESEIMDGIVAAFEAENPSIDIVRETKTLDDLKLVLKMSVESGEGPDIMQMNQGEADMGAMVRAGLLKNMNQHAEAAGWKDHFSTSMLKAMGYQGDFYGISTTAEVVGFYCNVDLLKKLGLSVPKTFAELETMLAAVKKAGYTPINFGNLDGWTGIHEWSALQHILTTRQELDDMMSGKPGRFWESGKNVRAAEILQDWVKKGYFTPDFSAIGYDDSANVFYQGDSLLMLTGNWLMGEMIENAPFEVGFFLMPAADPSLLKAIGGPGIPFVISAKSEAPDEAALFLDYLASAKTASAWADQLMLSAQAMDPSAYSGTPQLNQDILKAFNAVEAANGMGYFIDWITPTFYDTCSAAVQRLMALEITPDEFAALLQEDYSSFVK